ncbi:unnamed protein product [Calypogeia fissa]
MNHIPVVENERVVCEGRAVHDVAGGSNPPMGSDRSPTPKAPRWAEPDRVATPPEKPVGDEVVDDVLSDITAGPEDLGLHEDPEGLTPGDNAEALGPATQGDNQEVEVIVLDPEEDKVPEGDKAPEEEYAQEDNTPGNKEEEEMQFFSILRDIVTLAQWLEHAQFWRDMGLYDFVHLQWNTTIGTLEECVEFVKHSSPVASLVGKEVREAEEVRGGSNWAKHLFKQLHHELDVAKTTKKCRADNHIRIIFLALARDKKKKEAAKEDTPPGFPVPPGTKEIQSFGMTTPAGGAKSAMRGAVGAKAKPPKKGNPRQVLGIKKDIEVQVLANTNKSFKAIMDSNDKELMELGEERDEAVLDAANATSKVEALTEKIKELEGKLLALRSACSTPNKRLRDS